MKGVVIEMWYGVKLGCGGGVWYCDVNLGCGWVGCNRNNRDTMSRRSASVCPYSPARIRFQTFEKLPHNTQYTIAVSKTGVTMYSQCIHSQRAAMDQNGGPAGRGELYKHTITDG